MGENCGPITCLAGCHTAVPALLEGDGLCVLHFLVWVEHTCAAMRRETVVGGSSTLRRSEIATHVKTTAGKLSQVAVISPPLTDEMKRRVLTTLLTLMNLHESLDRSTLASAPGPKYMRSGARPFINLTTAHR